jgi:histidinol-phosphate aminotransferase
MIQSPEHIRTIQPYVPGKPIEELERELGITESVKLASNESPLGPSPGALKAIRRGLGDLNRYPDGSAFYLKKGLSSVLGITPDEILPGNGSNEIIELAIRTFLSPGDEAIMAQPSFVVYSTITRAAGGHCVTVPLQEWRHDLEAMASRITDRTKIIFIANPNNPTGTINTVKEMSSFMEKVPEGILVVVDEAYHEYVSSREYADSMKYVREGRDLLILRTFSKIYGLAGLRIGYAIAGAPIISQINRVRQPFNVNSLAQRAALAALEDREHVEKARKINERGKQFLYRELESLDIEYVKTEANFIYILFHDDIAPALHHELLKEGVIVRPMGPREMRITIGLSRENRRLVEVLKKQLVHIRK